MKAPGGILRTPRHRFTREGSLSRWDVDAKYHGVANQIESKIVPLYDWGQGVTFAARRSREVAPSEVGISLP